MSQGSFADSDASARFRTARSASPWREVELLVLLVLVLGAYFIRLTDLTIRGEESRWARVAQEMLDTGDWIVPRQQAEPFPDRPPLNSWLMILASGLTGGLNLAAIRLPAVTATLLVTLLIYLYSRNFLSRFGALAAAAAYPTMAQVLQLGRVAESDALLTLCVAAALFSWHFGLACRHSPRLAWIAGYAAAALAGLAKGPQGPLYFLAITGVFLGLRRDWSTLFSRWHLAGLVVFAAIIGAWQLPFYWELDATSARAVWNEGGEMSYRFDYSNLSRTFGHWLSYPFEVFACMMPWSFMLLVVPTRWFRAQLGDARPMAAFLLTAITVTLPTCWLPAHSRARYFMSLYPCVAPLIGLTIQRCWESGERGFWQRSWDRYLVGGVGLIAASGLFVALARLGSSWQVLSWSQAVSPAFAAAYALSAVAAASVVFWSRFRHDQRHAAVGLMAVAAFMGLTYTGVVISVQMQSSNNPSATIAAIREAIPPGERLMSFGKVHHLFAYYYGGPIELCKMGASNVATGMPGTYFCYAVDPKFKPPKIAFAWDHVADISCERVWSPRPVTKVVVGRRRSDPLTPNSQESSDSPAMNASRQAPTAAASADGLSRRQ